MEETLSFDLNRAQSNTVTELIEFRISTQLESRGHALIGIDIQE